MIFYVQIIMQIWLKVYSRLCALELSVSHSTLITLIKTLGKDHDIVVKKWQEDIS